MKRIDRHTVSLILAAICVVVLLLFTSCRTKIVHVPVETVRKEYRDRLERDSIYFRDSIFMKIQGDTIRIEKYKYLYRDKWRIDTLIRTDSVQVPYPVVEYREVNKIRTWQLVLMCLGGILIGGVGFRIFRYLR